MERKRNRSTWSINNLPLLYFFFSASSLIFTTASATNSCLDINSTLPAKPLFYFPEFDNTGKGKGDEKSMGSRPRGRQEVSTEFARRYLSGPGSSPPRCTSKCGNCTPCKPVHVPVPPGTPVTAEYYPEAWRCKCGNKLYMP